MSSDSPTLAVVTGAASGIGLALAQALAARGREVIAIDVDAIPSQNNIVPVQLDVRDADGMAALAARYAGRPVAQVFSNAGVGAGGAVFAANADWQRAWDINVLGHLNTLRAWWPQLERARGQAVATVSVAALLSYPGAALYRASKAALLSMLESLWYEKRATGVSVHALCPGMVQSNILANADKCQPPGPPDPLRQYLLEAMQRAEPAPAFAARVLDELDSGTAPFYWYTHANTREAIAARHAALQAGFPTTEFGAMP